jgi:hypothetical protein
MKKICIINFTSPLWRIGVPYIFFSNDDTLEIVHMQFSNLNVFSQYLNKLVDEQTFHDHVCNSPDWPRQSDRINQGLLKSGTHYPCARNTSDKKNMQPLRWQPSGAHAQPITGTCTQHVHIHRFWNTLDNSTSFYEYASDNIECTLPIHLSRWACIHVRKHACAVTDCSRHQHSNEKQWNACTLIMNRRKRNYR